MTEEERQTVWNLSVEIDGIERKLRTAGEVLDFVTKYREFYNFIPSSSDLLKPRTIMAQPLQWAGSLKRLETYVTNALTNSGDLETVKRWLRKGGEAKLPFHLSEDAQTIKRIWTVHGAKQGAGAALFCAGISVPEMWQDTDVVAGILMQVAGDGLIDMSGAKDAREALRMARSEHAAKIGELVKSAEEADAAFADAIQRDESEHKRLSNWILSGVQQHSTFLQEQVDSAIAALNGVKDTYTEYMRLKAPVDYWTKKAKAHDIGSGIWGTVALAWVLLAGFGQAFIIWQLFQYAITYAEEHTDIPVTVLSSLGALGLLTTTVFLWISRILVRLFLSEIHLGMDAKERVVMVQSYLALSNEDVVEPDQRAIVLSALFRPTQDGIVKDDAAADPTLVGLLHQLRGQL